MAWIERNAAVNQDRRRATRTHSPANSCLSVSSPPAHTGVMRYINHVCRILKIHV